MSKSDDLHHYHYGYPHMSPGDERRHQSWCEHFEKGGICNHYGRCIGSSQCRLYKKIDNGTEPFETDDAVSEAPQRHKLPAVFTPKILQIIAEKEKATKAKREAEERKRVERERREHSGFIGKCLTKQKTKTQRKTGSLPKEYSSEKESTPSELPLDEEIKQSIIQNNVRLWRIAHHKPVK